MKTCFKTSIAGIILLALSCLLSGCGSDECAPDAPAYDLESIWPNDDGRSWQYVYTWRVWDGSVVEPSYGSRDEVPPAPTLDEIEKILDSQPLGTNVEIRVGTYKMRFSGGTTTAMGITTQALVDTAYFPDEASLPSAGMNPARAMLHRLLHASPDTRAALVRSGEWDAPVAEAPIIVLPPQLIHGGAWEKTDEHIGTYNDFETRLGWKFLGADLSEGSEFTRALSPWALDDAYMHCRVLGEASVKTKSAYYAHGLECLYMIDYGPMQLGPPIRWVRNVDYGKVIYVPDVGPVYSYERLLVTVGDTLSYGVGDKTLTLK